MAIKIRDLSFPAYTDYGLRVRWKSVAAGVKTPVDVTNWTPKAEIRTYRENLLIDEFSVSKTNDPTLGIVIMTLDPAQSLPLVGDGDFVYSLVMTYDLDLTGNTIRELLRGRLYVAPQITVVSP